MHIRGIFVAYSCLRYKKKSGTIPTNPGAEKTALYSLISIYSTSIFLPGSVKRGVFSPMRFRCRGSESRFGVRGVRRSALPFLPNATTCKFDDMQKLKKYGASRGSAALSISRVARTPCHRLQLGSKLIMLVRLTAL